MITPRDPGDELPDAEPHPHWMKLALAEAELAFGEEEVPVGAVILHRGRIIARAHNQREQLRDPTAHAEMVAITQAAAARQSWRLDDCALYVTMEPCPMCTGRSSRRESPWSSTARPIPRPGRSTACIICWTTTA